MEFWPVKMRSIAIVFCVLLVATGLVKAQPFGPPPSNQVPGGNPLSNPNQPPPSFGRPPAAGNKFGPPNANAGPQTDPRLAMRTSAKPSLFKPAQVIARVGDEPIILGDVLGRVNQILEPHQGEVPEAELEIQRQKLVRLALKSAIENKLMYIEFLRNFPDLEKLPEIEQNVLLQFDKKQLPLMLEKAEVNTPGELDLHLRRYGSSLAKLKQQFIEQVFAGQMLREHVEQEPEVTHAEMLVEYRDNIKDYDIKPKVRWEQLVVRFDKFPDKVQAYRTLARMGNEVLRGAKFAAVAKARSQGFRADEGGYHDWTDEGSLASEVIERELFTLPIGKMSPIKEDKHGYYILRVIERAPAGRVPFTEAQVKIKDRIKQRKVKAAEEAFIAKIRGDGTDVWTIFDKENAAP